VPADLPEEPAPAAPPIYLREQEALLGQLHEPYREVCLAHPLTLLNHPYLWMQRPPPLRDPVGGGRQNSVPAIPRKVPCTENLVIVGLMRPGASPCAKMRPTFMPSLMVRRVKFGGQITCQSVYLSKRRPIWGLSMMRAGITSQTPLPRTSMVCPGLLDVGGGGGLTCPRMPPRQRKPGRHRGSDTRPFRRPRSVRLSLACPGNQAWPATTSG